jgi:hypothetical protein
MMANMIAPRCLIWGHQSTVSFPAIFAEPPNGFVGPAACFVAAPSTKQLHGIESLRAGDYGDQMAADVAAEAAAKRKAKTNQRLENALSQTQSDRRGVAATFR